MREINYMIAADALKSIKRVLPKQCTFLSFIKRKDASYYSRAKVNNENYDLSAPNDLSTFNEQDYERIYKLILDQCLKVN